MSAPITLSPQLPLDAVLDVLPHGVALTDRTGQVVATNRLWDVAAGDHDPHVASVGADLIGTLRHRTQPPSPVTEHIADGLGRLLDGRGHSFQVQYRLAASDELGEDRWFLLSAERMADGGIVVTRTETTVHHGVNEVLAELAFHDALTGLPNRGLLLDRVRMALIRAQRLDLRPLVAFADLDGFKEVNDQHGHEAGDAILVQVSRRLVGAIREGDTCGRWGGDEFVLVVELGEAVASRRVIERIVRSMEAPFVLPNGIEVPIGLSIGAVVADGTERVDSLIAAADHAMYEAKRDRRGPVVIVPAEPDDVEDLAIDRDPPRPT